MKHSTFDSKKVEVGQPQTVAKVRDFHDLRVWQSAMDLAEQVYSVSARFPKNELYGLTTQIRRAAISVPSNIAEGHTRESTKEYLHFVSVAQSSLSELSTQLELSMRLQYLAIKDLSEILTNSTSLRKQLYALRNALQR